MNTIDKRLFLHVTSCMSPYIPIKHNIQHRTLTEYPFNLETFEPVTNNPAHYKPNGGLFASYINAKFGWLDYLYVNSYRRYEFINGGFCCFTISPEARVFTCATNEDLEKLPIRKEDDDTHVYAMKYVDWEALAKEYDVFDFYDTQDTVWNMAGWDCDQIFVMNPAVIVPKTLTKEQSAQMQRLIVSKIFGKCNPEKSYFEVL